MFHLDYYGFVHGTDFQIKNEQHHVITSIDGYNSSLIVVDHKTWYTELFLTANKEPLCKVPAQFLALHGNQHTNHQIICTDQGGELPWGSNQFQESVQKAGYILESTAADAPFQNGMVEHPNKTLDQMMILQSTSLGSECWFFTYFMLCMSRIDYLIMLPTQHHFLPSLAITHLTNYYESLVVK